MCLNGSVVVVAAVGLLVDVATVVVVVVVVVATVVVVTGCCFRCLLIFVPRLVLLIVASCCLFGACCLLRVVCFSQAMAPDAGTLGASGNDVQLGTQHALLLFVGSSCGCWLLWFVACFFRLLLVVNFIECLLLSLLLFALFAI